MGNEKELSVGGSAKIVVRLGRDAMEEEQALGPVTACASARHLRCASSGEWEGGYMNGLI